MPKAEDVKIVDDVRKVAGKRKIVVSEEVARYLCCRHEHAEILLSNWTLLSNWIPSLNGGK